MMLPAEHSGCFHLYVKVVMDSTCYCLADCMHKGKQRILSLSKDFLVSFSVCGFSTSPHPWNRLSVLVQYNFVWREKGRVFIVCVVEFCLFIWFV